MLRFDGQVAIVTGAGRGIGREHALALARRGARVIVNDLGGSVQGVGASSEPAQQVVDEIRAQGGDAIADMTSVATEEGAAAIVRLATDVCGRVDIIIHNAGVTNASWSKMLDLHLSAAFWLCRAAWPHFIAQNYGRVLTTSSAAGLFGTRPAEPEPLEYYAYAAAKAGLVGLTRNLALEGAGNNIKINGVAPIAWSRMIASNLKDERTRQWMERCFGAEHIAQAAVCLVHERCPTSGATYSVGGGRVASVVIAETDGYFEADLSAETLMERFAAVVDQKRLHTPRHIPDELNLYRTLCRLD